MLNRAKCKLCHSIIESRNEDEYIECLCGEISVDGGDKQRCSARNWKNFVRVDDEGNEIVVVVKEKDSSDQSEESQKFRNRPNKKELIDMLDTMIANIEKLPPLAMTTPVTQYDHLSLMLLIAAIFREE